MFEKIRGILSDLMDALEGDRALGRDEVDRVLAEMREELIEARARLRKREGEVADFERRLDALREDEDVERGRLAELEREVAARRAEVDEERAAVDDLSRRYREAVRHRDVWIAKDRRTRASETLQEAGEEGIGDFERLEERIEADAHRLEADREVEEALESGAGAGGNRPAGAEDAGLEEDFRDVRAEEQLRELKRRMGMDPDEGD